MLQHLLRRLVFDVPILNEYAKMPLKVWHYIITHQYYEFKLVSTVISFACDYFAAAYQSLRALLEVLLFAQWLG